MCSLPLTNCCLVLYLTSSTYELGDLEQVAQPYLQISFLTCKNKPHGVLGKIK